MNRKLSFKRTGPNDTYTHARARACVRTHIMHLNFYAINDEMSMDRSNLSAHTIIMRELIIDIPSETRTHIQMTHCFDTCLEGDEMKLQHSLSFELRFSIQLYKLL